MKISYNWLKDYLPVDMNPEKVGKILTDIGLEVEGIEEIGGIEGGLAGLVVGEVKTAVQHPNADKLKLTTVDVGNGEPLAIVCGAPNVAAGQKVVVATVGSTLYPIEGKPFKIKKGKIRGEVSLGMICAEDEIGLGTDHDGIIVLPDTTKVGMPAIDAFDLDTDYIFEVGLTPNRSDAICHLGVAKDLLAALQINHDFDKNIKVPSVTGFKVDNTKLNVGVKVENTEACPRYSGVTITGVTIKESPEWMQIRLNAIGIRPINNVVDITNFILHELGQPLHAFDADKIDGQEVIVKNLPQDTAFVTLDEKERKLNAKDLIICNGKEEPMCMAGVFGGLTSGVTDTTTNIFLESACFHPIKTRQTATRHNLRTDAAIRFEKGVDPNGTVYALKRAVLLIKELAGGTIASEIVDVYPTKVARPIITVQYKRINSLIGVEIPAAEVKAILTALDIQTVSETAETLTVSVGTNRADVLREVDIIEEILRIYGFNKVPIPTTLQSAIVSEAKPNPTKLRNLISDFLASKGFNEMMGTSISNSVYYGEGKNVVTLLKSLNANLDVLRKNMLYSGLEAIIHNQNHKNTDLHLFEFGKTYEVYAKESGNQYQEYSHLSFFVTGNTSPESWQHPQRKVAFFDVKKVVNEVLQRLGISRFNSVESKSEQLAYGLQYKMGKQVLVDFGLVHPKICKNFGIKQAVFYADFNWDTILTILKRHKVTFTPINKYPSVRRDLALLIDKQTSFGQVETIAKKTGKKLLQSVNLFDIYADESKIGKGKKSYAVSFVFQDANKTLTDKEIDKVMNKLIATYQKQLGAELR